MQNSPLSSRPRYSRSSSAKLLTAACAHSYSDLMWPVRIHSSKSKLSSRSDIVSLDYIEDSFRNTQLEDIRRRSKFAARVRPLSQTVYNSFMKPTGLPYVCQIYSGIVAALAVFSVALLVVSYAVRLTANNLIILDRAYTVAIVCNFAAAILGGGLLPFTIRKSEPLANGLVKNICLALIMLMLCVFLLPAIAWA
jgi:hypothetical protein